MPSTSSLPLSRVVRVRRVGHSLDDEASDRVAVESPLEIRLHGAPLAVVMRTPGADRDLVAGFLLAEGVIISAADLARIDAPAEDVVDVTLTSARAGQVPMYLSGGRQFTTSSSCGVCGRRDLESLEIDEPPIDAAWRVPAEVIVSLPGRLRASQLAFDETGGLHAAGLFSLDGTLEVSAEDVGRHNAVDKLVGRMLLAGRVPLDRSILFVSGRTSFEIVQKAWLARVPLIAAVSAPSSLAVEIAGRGGITLAGFVRDGRFNLYSHEERVAMAADGLRLQGTGD